MSHASRAGRTGRSALARSAARLVMLWASLGAACTSIPRFPVGATVGLEPLETTVDSELAARYLRQVGGDAAFDSDPAIRALEAEYDPKPLTAGSLRALSDESSVDFATAYFVRRILSVRRHRAAQGRFVQRLADLRAMKRPRIDGADPARYLLLFVPGLFYRRHPESGAAMEVPRRMYREMGFKTRLVEVDELGKVEDNARMVAEELERLRGTDRRIILFSASKGGADTAHALGSLLAGRDLRHVAGWVSLGGILHGSPRADRALRWPNSWVVGTTGWLSGATLPLARDLSTKTSAQRASSYAFPEHLVILHYVSTPFSGTVTPPARSAYARMRRLGPNDGVTLLPDQLLPRGQAVLAVGLDHYFRDPESDLRAVALAGLAIELVEADRGRAEPGPIPAASPGSRDR